jgi:prefoldin alpha subunit
LENSQNLQQQLTQYRYIEEQRNLYQSQLELVNASLANLQNTKLTLEKIKEGVKEDDDILLPIGGLVKIRAKIMDTQKILVSVGQDIVIEKSLDESISFLESIIEKQKESLKFVVEKLQNIELALQSMGESIQSGMRQNPQ